ncbi:UPF0602 protein C4orf47 like protein, partial [Dufourea novaeangliae]
GFFHDPSPAPFDTYGGGSGAVKFRRGIEKGRQLHPGPPTPLFDEKFTRIFNGEALNEPWRLEAENRLKLEKKNIGGRMLPPSPAKRHATPGDYHGCFEKISHFDPAVREKKKSEPEPPNAKIKPNPRGGPGYVDICLNPFPPHSHDPYDQETRQKIGKSVGRFLYASAPLDYFPPNPYEVKTLGSTYTCPEKVTVKMKPPGRIYVPFPKKPGGNHSGCFDKFPTYKSDPYMKDTAKDKKEKGRFHREKRHAPVYHCQLEDTEDGRREEEERDSEQVE